MNYKESALNLLKLVKDAGLEPKQIETTSLGDDYLVNVFHEKTNLAISENVYSGVASDQFLALEKALCEMLERYAFWEWAGKTGYTSGSTGVAAYYCLNNFKISQKLARKKALEEALERYFWCEWWRNNETYFEVEDYKSNSLLSEAQINCMLSLDHFEGLSIVKIPGIYLENKYELHVGYLKLKNQGYTMAGCLDSCRNNSMTRMFYELLRHTLAYSKMKQNEQRETLYEKRLYALASGNYNQLLESRLSTKGKLLINAPELKFDQPLPHRLDQVATVWRCELEGQGSFITDSLDEFYL